MSLPTQEHCDAMVAFRINRAHFGTVSLDGLCFGGLFAWPGPIHEGRGELSYAKVRALTRVATPVDEAFQVQIGLNGTAHHVEELVRKYRRVLQVGEFSREERQQANRTVRISYDDDGSVILKARLSAETFLVYGAEAMNGGERYQIVVHVDHDTLMDSAPGRSEFEGGSRRAP